MYLRAKFGIVALIAASIFATVALILLSRTEMPSDAQMREAFEDELSRFAPVEATMCGVVSKGSSRSDAIACARNHILNKVPFLVAFQEQGIDSDVWSALAGSSQGELQILLLDSSPHGQPQTRAEYFVTSRTCVEPTFSIAGYGAIRCEGDGPPNSR